MEKMKRRYPNFNTTICKGLTIGISMPNLRFYTAMEMVLVLEVDGKTGIRSLTAFGSHLKDLNFPWR